MKSQQDLWEIAELPDDPDREGGKAWPFPFVTEDYRNLSLVWREISEHDAIELRDCLPPIYVEGGFMVGEAANHEPDGSAVYTGISIIGERYFARDTTRKRWSAEHNELIRALGAGIEGHPR